MSDAAAETLMVPTTPLDARGPRACSIADWPLSPHADEPERDGEQEATATDHGVASTMTVVALTTAVARSPGSSASSSAASRVMSETTRCGPAWISITAVRVSRFDLEDDPGEAIAGRSHDGRRHRQPKAACSRRYVARSAPAITRWPPSLRVVARRPSSHHRRTVSTLTPSNSATCPGRYSLMRGS